MFADPWFSTWNYRLFQVLFRLLPHNAITDDYCDLLILTPVLSTWVFAACFYQYWTKNDEQQAWRRSYLVRAVVALGIAGFMTLVLRPWIHWPAPDLNPHFQLLFPPYLWGNGSKNCFPSHSTLAYFMMAAGFWPLNRRLSLWLSGMALFFISLPRVYEGGHYPVDVVFSCVLGVLVLVAVWRWPVPASLSNWWTGRKSQGAMWDLIFFLWVFELGEGFRSLELLASVARRVSRSW
jgi:membrane-associated phospholipid phosphatase